MPILPQTLRGFLPCSLYVSANHGELHAIEPPQPGGSSFGVVSLNESAAAIGTHAAGREELAAKTVADAARLISQNPLSQLRLIVPSGRLGSVSEAGSLAWLPSARADFSAWCTAIERVARADMELVIWPHASGSISDVPSLQSFLRERGGRWKFLFDPVAMLTESMLPRQEDHFDRLFDSLAGHPLAAAAVVDQAVFERAESRWQGVALGLLVRRAS